jgi:hypothetical protein
MIRFCLFFKKRKMLGRKFLGEAAWDYITRETPVFADFYAYFDEQVLDADNTFLYGNGGAKQRDATICRLANEAIDQLVANPKVRCVCDC